MDKHTPGPWLVNHRFARVIPAAHAKRPIGGHEDAAIDLKKYAQEICALQWPDRHRGQDEVMANAKLIAAAPELLDALHALLFEIQPDADATWAKGSGVELARAAIAKATA